MSESLADFAKRVVEFFAAQGEVRPVAFDSAQGRLLVGSAPGPISFVSLGHAYDEYCEASGGERQSVLLRRFWSSIEARHVPHGERFSRHVLPRVRDRAWFSAVRRQAELELGGDTGAVDEVMLPFKELNDELGVHLAYELPTSVMELGPDRLVAWGKGFDEVLVCAVDNLAARSHRPLELVAPGVYASSYQDGLDASRMLLRGLFDDLPLKGAPIALAPTQDTLLVTGEDDQEGLEQMAVLAEEAIMRPRAHTAVAFRLEDDRWVPFMPPRDNPVWSRFRLLALQTLASAYARQKDILESLLRGTTRAAEVVGLRAFRDPAGEVLTACTWLQGAHALLPRTDRIDFAESSGLDTPQGPKVWSTSFEVALATVGDFMQPTGDIPERYLVHRFPSEQQLQAMVRAGNLADPDGSPV